MQNKEGKEIRVKTVVDRMRKTWLSDVVGTEKAAIGVVHFKAFPSDPLYDYEKGMEEIVEGARKDLIALQNGGIDAVLFSNEFSFPYESEPSTEVIAGMAYVIGRLKDDIKVPYGANVISNTDASIALNAAIGGQLMRGTFAGAFSGNMGLINAKPGKFLRHRHNLGLDDKLKMVHYVIPESSCEIGGRDKHIIANGALFGNLPDAIGICGANAGKKIDLEFMREIRKQSPDTVLFATTGVNYDTIEEIFEVADAAFIATHLKVDGVFENAVDEARVKRFMDKLKAYRSN